MDALDSVADPISDWADDGRDDADHAISDDLNELDDVVPFRGLVLTVDAPIETAQSPLSLHHNGASVEPAGYVEFTGATSPALTTSRSELVEEILAIVTVEGPMLGERLHQAHVRAAGGQRVGRQIAHHLNSAITKALASGHLI